MNASHRSLLAIAFAVLPVVYAGADERSDLLDLIDASITAGTEFRPFDCIGTIDQITQFGDEIDRTISTRFRLALDPTQERAAWAAVQTLETAEEAEYLHHPQLPRKLTQSRFTLVSGSKLQSGRENRTYDSFEQALEQSDIPLPKFWGVLMFSEFRNPNMTGQTWRPIILTADSVRVADTPRGVRYALRWTMQEGVQQQATWEFEQPSHQTVKHKQGSFVDGKFRVNHEQEVTYEEVQGHRVPTIITRSTGAFRPRDRKSQHLMFTDPEEGKSHTDIEIHWLRVGRLLDESESFPRPQRPQRSRGVRCGRLRTRPLVGGQHNKGA